MHDYSDRTIVDVGAHKGDDSEFYLAKGFSVVGVEANPVLADILRKRFAEPIRAGRYELIEAAVAAHDGDVEFFVNLDKDDWSSTDPVFGTRDGTRFRSIRVPAFRFDALLSRLQNVYYIKCDIEGGDIEVLRGLHASSVRPRYVSFEAHSADYLAHLRVLGYSKFKLVNQNLNWLTKLPNPPLEGRAVEHRFPGDSSGPFGDETVGEWLGFEEVTETYLALKRIAMVQRHLSIAWYDVHARFDPEPERPRRSPGAERSTQTVHPPTLSGR
jgi:FkbM family methyltransferase